MPDERWKKVEATMRRHGYQPHSLIEALHAAQEAYGHLTRTIIGDVATALRVAPSRAYGVATFYNFFTLAPPGRHVCEVCTGTACYIRGGTSLLEAAAHAAGVEAGETTGDGEVSVLVARCFGACGLAPAAMVDGEMVGALTPESIAERVKGWRPR